MLNTNISNREKIFKIYLGSSDDLPVVTMQ
jgi:hypothetical protein